MSQTSARPAGTDPAARAAIIAAAAAARAAPDWDLVLKRNNVEKLKREKFPLEIVNEIDELGQRNYLDISEEDMVRFQWYGLYQDKPKVGYFMLRIKAPSGIMTAAQYRAIGELSVKFGRDYTELSTRQNVQLHWLQIKQFREVFAALDAVGLTSLGGCGDSVRNITGCPVVGIDADELFDCRQQLDEVVDYFLTNREYFDLPRKHKITISTCAAQCNAPEINCIVFIGTQQEGRDGFSLRVGGGLSSTPRIARDLNAFVPQADALPVAKAILDVWRTDLRYRLSRAKARLKFMVDDYGPEGVREAVEKQLGRQLEDLQQVPKPVGSTDHLGAHRQKQDGRYYIGLQGTTARGDEAGHDKLEAYEIYLRGGLGENAEIGRPLLRRVPTEEASAYVERLVAAYLNERQNGESFQAFAKRKSDEELISIGTGQPAPVPA